MAGQVAADPAVDGAEVLADRDAARARGRARERRHRRVVVIADVGAAVGGLAGGHPPQPRKAHDVVDAQAARVPQRGPEQLGQRPVAGRRQPLRVPGRLAPVLAELVEAVRRRAHGDAGDQQPRMRPGVGAAGVHAHGEVMDDAVRHPGGRRRPLRAGQLLIAMPLQPGMERRGAAQPGIARHGRLTR